MANKSYKEFLERLFGFSTQMSAASLAIVGLLLVITYEFQHVSEFTESLIWSRFAHLGIAAAIFFLISSFMGLIQRAPFLPLKLRKLVSWIMFVVFSVGWILLIYLLLVLFIETY